MQAVDREVIAFQVALMALQDALVGGGLDSMTQCMARVQARVILSSATQAELSAPLTLARARADTRSGAARRASI